MSIALCLDKDFKSFYNVSSTEEEGLNMISWMQQSFHVSSIEFAGYIAPGSGTPVHKNRRAHGIVLQTSGSAVYSFELGTSITLRVNDLLFLPQGSCYTVAPSSDSDCYCINFRAIESISSKPFSFHTGNAAQFLALFKDAVRLHHSHNPARHDMVLSCLYSIIYALKSEYFKAYTPSDRLEMLRPAIEYIEKRFPDGNISIPCLANLCGISPVYFRRVFHAVYGMPPVQYIREIRLTRARELLIGSSCSIQSIAEQCGFSSDCAFSREFKKACGLSPSDYRKCL